MTLKVRLLASAAFAMALAGASSAFAQTATAPPPAVDPGSAAPAVSEVVVTAQRLNAAREAVQPSLGCTCATTTTTCSTASTA